MKKSKIIVLMAATILAGCAAPAPKEGGNSTAVSSATEPVANQELNETLAALEQGKELAAADEDGGYETDMKKDYASAEMEVSPVPESSEEYLSITPNRLTAVSDQPMMTFSLKVDTAAYNNIERYLKSGNLPPQDAVKTEELLNYFNYDQPMDFSGDQPFSIYTEVGVSPFSADRYLALVRVKAKELDKAVQPASNLTFLIDTSGSMDSYDKLPLLKSAFKLLVEQLGENDKVSIVTYAGSSEIVLDSVSGSDQDAILKAFDRLEASGSTAGADGILTAYALTEKNFKQGGNNRIILATDGDFNVGVSSVDELESLVAEKRQSGIYFSVLGFGTGNLKDDRMETIAKNGNGNYSYISSVAAAKKVLVEEIGSNLFVIAEDVKAQLEFNPQLIKGYRLLGYENRMMDNADFENDQKDAGEIGIGTDVVILVELEMNSTGTASGLKYGDPNEEAQPEREYANELFEVRIRYKNPGEQESRLVNRPVTRDEVRENNSGDFKFARSVAGFAQLLRSSEAETDYPLEAVIRDAEENLGVDAAKHRYDYLELLFAYGKLIERAD